MLETGTNTQTFWLMIVSARQLISVIIKLAAAVSFKSIRKEESERPPHPPTPTASPLFSMQPNTPTGFAPPERHSEPLRCLSA